MLASLIIDRVTQSPIPSQLLYFYCPSQYLKPANLYGSLIRQTLESNFDQLPDFIETYVDAARNRRPSEHELKDIFHKLIPKIPGNTTIIIDGLNDTTDTENILNSLAELHRNCDIKLLITSWDEPETIHIPGMLELRIQPGLVANDVLSFVMREMERQPTLKKLKPKLKTEVIGTVIRGSNGA